MRGNIVLSVSLPVEVVEWLETQGKNRSKTIQNIIAKEMKTETSPEYLLGLISNINTQISELEEKRTILKTKIEPHLTKRITENKRLNEILQAEQKEVMSRVKKVKQLEKLKKIKEYLDQAAKSDSRPRDVLQKITDLTWGTPDYAKHKILFLTERDISDYFKVRKAKEASRDEKEKMRP